MNKVQKHASRPLSAPDYPFQLTRKLWLPISLAIALIHFLFWRPDQDITIHDGPAPIWFALLCAATLGYGLAVIAALIIRNWHKKRTVLWPTKGKFIGAFALTFVTPVVVFSGLPWIIGGLFLAAAPSFSLTAEFALTTMRWTLIPMLAWYLPSALIICGTRSHKLRFGLYCIMFWSCYAAHILYTGLVTFRL